MAKSNKHDKTAKKMEILKAAVTVFAKKGVSNTKMDDIAVMAGVGKGTIYEYFRSKDEIFHEAHQQFHKGVDRIINKIVQSDNSPDMKLKMLVDTSLQLFFKKSNKISIISSQELTGILMEFWAKGIREGDKKLLDPLHLKKSYRKYRKLLAGVIQDGIEKGIFRKTNIHLSASLILAILDGLPLQKIIDKSAFKYEEMSNFVLDNILSLVKK